jgi:ATP-dependent Clp protease ATP-binding subunit ClpC
MTLGSVILPLLVQEIPAMFERCAQNARRVIFLASEEATRRKSVPRKRTPLARYPPGERSIGGPDWRRAGSIQLFRKQIEAEATISQPNESRETPLGPNSKRILDFAAEEAGALGQRQITLGHYLLGILRADKCIAARILQAHGATITAMREETSQDARWAG